MAYSEYLTKRQKYELLRGSLSNERSAYESDWKKLAQFIRPSRERFFSGDRNKGQKRSSTVIINETATFAARTLQSGMHAGMTSPSRPWLKLGVEDLDLADYGPVKEWLHTVTRRMLTLFQRSNTYQSLPIIYGDESVFGTAAMCAVEDDASFLRTHAYPIGSYYLGVSERGTVDTFIRDRIMTVRQIVETFGRIPGTRNIDWSKLSIQVKNQWDRSNYETAIEVCWVVTPNEQYDADKLDAQYKRWASCHFEKGCEENKFLRESGYNEFPIMAPRWGVTGSEDIYAGECPGMDTIGGVKSLQLMEKKLAQGIEKGLNPPVQAPTHLRNQPVSLLPGGVTYVDTNQHQQGVRPIHETNMDVSHIGLEISRIENRIQRGFYEDLFLMLTQTDRREITAREVEERHEEKLIMLGPVTERNNGELLDPFIDRTYAMMDRAGMIPEPPEEMQGMPLKVEYLGILAQAQKLVGLAGHERFLATTVGLTEAFPQVRHKVNIFQAVDDLGDMLSVNPKLIVPDDDAQASLQAEQQAAMQQMRVEQEAMAAKGVRDLGQTPTDTDSALSRILEGAQ